MTDNPVQRHYDLSMRASRAIWGMFDLDEAEEVIKILETQKELSNKLFWSRARAKTGNTAQENAEKLADNTEKLRAAAAKADWLGIGENR